MSCRTGPIITPAWLVSPDNANEVYTVCGAVSLSLDGGETFKRISLKGGDNHDMWIDPKNGNRMLVANDQHISITLNRGKTWNGVSLPNAQMYHVFVDNQIPYFVYGNKQDGPSYRGPSNSKQSGSSPPRCGIMSAAAKPASRFPIPLTTTSSGRASTRESLPATI